jgi:hypothetical protein
VKVIKEFMTMKDRREEERFKIENREMVLLRLIRLEVCWLVSPGISSAVCKGVLGENCFSVLDSLMLSVFYLFRDSIVEPSRLSGVVSLPVLRALMRVLPCWSKHQVLLVASFFFDWGASGFGRGTSFPCSEVTFGVILVGGFWAF